MLADWTILATILFTFWVGRPCSAQDSTGNDYAIADPATLWDILKDGTQNVIKNNHDELKHWQPYGDVDDV